MATKAIDQATLTRLIEAGVIRGIELTAGPDGWTVVIKYGVVEQPLAGRRGALRAFRKLETLVRYLKALGLTQYTVNASGFDPDNMKRSRRRGDASERLQRLYAVAATSAL